LTTSAALRAISWRDWRRLARLSLEAFPDATPAQVSQTLRDISNVIVLEIDGEPAGYVAFRHEKPGALWLDWVAVDSRYRGRGCGARLVGAVEPLAVRRGYTTVTLAVLKTNHGAFRFYRSHGYELASEDERKYHLEKQISGYPGDAPDIPARPQSRPMRLWHRLLYGMLVESTGYTRNRQTS
jgi:ribosomal protein S18 acetylase RimI-like enzyme